MGEIYVRNDPFCTGDQVGALHRRGLRAHVLLDGFAFDVLARHRARRGEGARKAEGRDSGLLDALRPGGPLGVEAT